MWTSQRQTRARDEKVSPDNTNALASTYYDYATRYGCPFYKDHPVVLASLNGVCSPVTTDAVSLVPGKNNTAERGLRIYPLDLVK